MENRVNFIKKLQSFGIPASVVHLRIDHNSVFGGITPNLPNQEKFNENQVCIPINESLSEENTQKIVTIIKQGW